MRSFLFHSGLSMVQVLMVLGLVAGGSVVMVKNMTSQEKIMKFASNRAKASQLSLEISEALTDAVACTNTLKQNANILDKMTAIYSASNTPMYVIGSEKQGGTLVDIQLVNFSPAPGYRYTPALLRLTLKFHDLRVNDNGSFGGTQKNYDIPLFLITNNNVVETCMSDETESIAVSVKATCEGFGGTYNPLSGGCDNLKGPNSIYLKHVKDIFCNTGSTCPHPYAGQVCTGTDIRGVDHGNWVISGFDGSGKYTCTCMPRNCPDPSSVCEGEDLGTDWCQLECPKGTYVPNDYGPDTSTECSGVEFTQTNSCGKTRSATGTKVCP